MALRSVWLIAFFRGGGGRVVTHAGQTEQVARELGTFGMKDEGAAHAEHAAEQARFENDVVAG